MTTNHGWTLVQHSGALSHEEFIKAVQPRVIISVGERRIVESVGGRVFDSYSAAEEECERLNYPKGTEGLVPAYAGTFSEHTLGGLRIAIPALVR